MRTGWLTVILLVVSIALLAVVPALRETALMIFHGRDIGPILLGVTKAQADAIVQQHPDDADLWLGYAEIAAYSVQMAETFATVRKMKESADPEVAELWSETDELSAQDMAEMLGEPWPPDRAYQQAIALAPNSPAPLLRYALYLLAQTRRADEAAEEARSAEDAQRLLEVGELLQHAQELDPENAACDYLLACLYLQQGQDEAAFAALRSGLARPHWRTGTAEATRAVAKLLDTASVPPLLKTTLAFSSTTSVGAVMEALRELSLDLADRGEAFRKRGHHAQAIVCFETVIHLGHIMRTDAYTIIDGLVGVSMTQIASRPFLTSEQSRQIEESAPIDEAPRKQKEAARTKNLAAYLRQHDQADLADLYETDMEAAAVWKEKARAYAAQIMPRLLSIFFGGPMRYTNVVWGQTSLLLAIWILVGIVSVAMRYWREQRRAPPWTYWEWFVLLVAAVVGGQVLSAWTKTAAMSGREWSFESFFWIVPSSAGIGVALWLGLVLFISLKKRIVRPVEERRGKFRAYLASLRTLLPPTFAAFCIIAVLGLYSLRSNMEMFDQEQQAMIEQGEVHYWGIGSP